MVSPRATALSTARREAPTLARACGAMVTGATPRATATTSAIERECPSSVTEGGMRKEGTRPYTRRQAYKRRVARSHPGHSRLATACNLASANLPRNGYRFPCQRFRRQLRTPRIRLHAPVEEHVLTADRGDAQRGVVIRTGLVALEHVTVPGHRLVHVASVADRGREVDRRQVGDGLRAIDLHAVARELRHDPQGGIARPVHPEVDVRAVAVLHQTQLARIADTVGVGVVPETEPRLGRLLLERIDQHVARVGARRVLAQRRPEALVAPLADRRDAEAARRAVDEQGGEKLVGHGLALERPVRTTYSRVEIVARAVHAIPLESGVLGRVVGPPEMDGLIQRNRAKRVGSLQPEPLIDGDNVRQIALATVHVERADGILELGHAVVVERVRTGLAAQLERARGARP